MAHDVDVLKTDVSRLASDLADSKEWSRVRSEPVDDNFKIVFERFQALSEQVERGFADVRRQRHADMAFLREVLGDHERRLQALERRTQRGT